MSENGTSAPRDEPTPWIVGTVCAVLVAVLATALVCALGLSLTRINAPFAVVVVAIVIAGVAPTFARYRTQPVWRWIGNGAAAGAGLGIVILLGELVFRRGRSSS